VEIYLPFLVLEAAGPTHTERKKILIARRRLKMLLKDDLTPLPSHLERWFPAIAFSSD
jgi:hypothetical protein